MKKYDELSEFLLRMGDSALIQGQRLCEWCGHAPALEEEMALRDQSLLEFGIPYLAVLVLIYSVY